METIGDVSAEVATIINDGTQDDQQQTFIIQNGNIILLYEN